MKKYQNNGCLICCLRMNYNQPTDVLIIDDDVVNNFIAETLIKRASKHTNITVCLNGRDAIEKLLSIKQESGKLPEFIFLDLAMPVMDGWKFLDEYHRLNIGDGSNSQIIILSSSIFRHDIDRALKHSVVKEYISKPLNMELIRKVLKIDHHIN
jgi:CheY-like chemotaxis protein